MKMKKAFDRDSNADDIESDARKILHQSYQDYLQKLTNGSNQS